VPRKSIESVFEAHTERLMSLPGVVGMAIGECNGQPCIRVFVARKTIELLNRVPSIIEEYPVVVDETGGLHAIQEG
jgi:hypothetical protein